MRCAVVSSAMLHLGRFRMEAVLRTTNYAEKHAERV